MKHARTVQAPGAAIQARYPLAKLGLRAFTVRPTGAWGLARGQQAHQAWSASQGRAATHRSGTSVWHRVGVQSAQPTGAEATQNLNLTHQHAARTFRQFPGGLT